MVKDQTKIYINSIKVNSLGGLDCVAKELYLKNIHKLIDDSLGARAPNVVYSYSDIVLHHIYSLFCKSSRLEHSKGVQRQTCYSPVVKMPSPDTIGNQFKFLSEKNINEFCQKTADVERSYNLALNKLMVQIGVRLNLINAKRKLQVLDIDGTLIHCDKADSKYTYERKKGYFPTFAMLNNMPLYVEAKNGNIKDGTNIIPTYQRIKEVAQSRRIKFTHLRADAAFHNNDLMQMLEKDGILYFIRRKRIGVLDIEDFASRKWEKVLSKKYGVFEVSSKMHFNKKTNCNFRLVTTRVIKQQSIGKKKLNYTDYVMRSIMTNDTKISDKEVVKFYNGRGLSEKHFSYLKQNFKIDKPPFSFLDQNLVFWIINSIGLLVYEYMIAKYSKISPKTLTPKIRMGKFYDRLVFNSILYWAGGIKLLTEPPDDILALFNRVLNSS